MTLAEYRRCFKLARRHARNAAESADLLHEGLLAGLQAGRLYFSGSADRAWLAGTLAERLSTVRCAVMKNAVVALLLWLALSPAFAEESPASAFFEKLAGHWQGTGQVRDMAADMRMTWEPVLDVGFLRLTMDNWMTGTDGKTWNFKAEAFYRIETGGEIVGTWFDSRGISLPLAGRVEQDSMTIQWGTDAIERGRSHYRLSAEGLEVTDEVLTKEGEWRTFGRTRLTRKTP